MKKQSILGSGVGADPVETTCFPPKPAPAPKPKMVGTGRCNCPAGWHADHRERHAPGAGPELSPAPKPRRKP